MENGRIKEKKNRQEFEHNLPGPSYDLSSIVDAGNGASFCSFVLQLCEEVEVNNTF